MTDSRKDIGKKIISMDSSIGEIVDITTLEDGGEEFYKVTFPKQNCINYISKTNQGYRILSSEATAKEAIGIFTKKHKAVEYATAQEKINTQKQILKENDICKLAEVLAVINMESEIHAQVNKTFSGALKSFVDEIKQVTGMKKAEVYDALNIDKSRRK